MMRANWTEINRSLCHSAHKYLQLVLNLKPVSSLSHLKQQFPKNMKIPIVACVFVYVLRRANDLIYVKQPVPSKPLINASYHYCFSR